MGIISFSQFIVLGFFILLIFGDFSQLIGKVKNYVRDVKKKNRKKRS